MSSCLMLSSFNFLSFYTDHPAVSRRIVVSEVKWSITEHSSTIHGETTLCLATKTYTDKWLKLYEDHPPGYDVNRIFIDSDKIV